MSKFLLCDEKSSFEFVIESEAFEGVKEIGKTVAEDIRLVTGKEPVQVECLDKVQSEVAVIAATVGKSSILDAFSKQGIVDTSLINGKREVFMMKTIELSDALSNIKRILVIAGSDKRGTIYGIFRLSELCGVSPLVYFGDAMPEKKDVLEIDIAGLNEKKQTTENIVTNEEEKDGSGDELFISKEPSVYYRGFFINDEWPAFGNWATDTFGGVNAKCYKKIFELLLRLKGNYMWPAMWNSNFSEEGPGIENALLADMYGVVMGTSHHEPLCRAGNEWQQQYKKYGDDNSWSFISNEEAITKFWVDGVLRNREFENVYTIGMRGEADSKLLPEDATMKDNIEVVKKAILAQDNILKEKVSDKLADVPRMLAIYKEVEDYYYGDETCEGLKDWDELKDAIFLLSDDNHGNLRNLPTEAERSHAGGYGMYYHFDYHGAPISYEWTNCNRLTKTWEQMTQAYEAGVTKMWIVNVGDLKEMEYPLSFFMELAYDYETWGQNGLNRTKEFAYKWIDKQFGARLTSSQKDDMFKVLEGYTRFNAMRTPETMNDMIYHPVHYREGERLLGEARGILETAEKLNQELNGEALLTYQSMIYYAAAASLNLVIAWILTGMNHEYAKKGCVYANSFIAEIEERIKRDQELVDSFHKMADGKWNHCLASAHTGFRTWDDREWAYPVTCKVSPISVAKAMVSFRGQDRYHLGAHWQDMAPIVSTDLLYDQNDEALLDIDLKGNVACDYKITLESDALKCDLFEGKVKNDPGRETITFRRSSSLKAGGDVEVKGRVDISFENGQKTYVDLLFKVFGKSKGDNENVLDSYIKGSAGVVGKDRTYCCFRASEFDFGHLVDDNGFEVIEFLGREGNAIKALPPMRTYASAQDAPYVSYNVRADEAGEYDIIFYLLTRNPSVKGGRMNFFMAVNEEEPVTVHSVSDHYYTEWQDTDWAQGVLTAGRQVSAGVTLNAGINSIKVFAGEPGVIIEKIVIKKKDYLLPVSYLGPNL
nr:glycosyl hydrolase 115 family protein [uncultured Butyrivibrio sp.]